MFHAERPSLQIEMPERIMNGPIGELTRSSVGVDCNQEHYRWSAPVVAFYCERRTFNESYVALISTSDQDDNAGRSFLH